MSASLPTMRTTSYLTRQARPRFHGVTGALSLQLPSKKFKITEQGAKELAPHMDS
jgi:hypothetical protein